jgi:hypothetical protein
VLRLLLLGWVLESDMILHGRGGRQAVCARCRARGALGLGQYRAGMQLECRVELEAPDSILIFNTEVTVL